MGISVASSLPAGTVADFAGASAPNGWLFCYGQAVSRSLYSALFSAIGTAFGAGDGSTTFNLPDARGRALFGKDDMGGAAANRLTSGGSGVAGATLGANGGAETVTLSTAQMPAHTHNFTAVISSGTNGLSGPTLGSDKNLASSVTASLGGGGAHNTVPPALVMNKIIKV